MPNTVKIKRCIRKEPSTREDQLLLRLKKAGMLPGQEEKVYCLPKAPGVFSLGPEHSPVQVPNSAVVQPTVDLDLNSLDSVKNSFNGLF